MKTQINYGINRPNPNRKGRQPKIEHENHKTIIAGSINDSGNGFTLLVQAHVAVAHPGWSLTGYAPTGVVLSMEEVEAAFEMGYRCAEKGENLQLALEHFRVMLK